MDPEWAKKKLLVRDLIEILEEHPHVLRVEKKYHHLAIKFDTGITEYWNLSGTNITKINTFDLPMNCDLFNEHEITVHRQFETNPLYPEEFKILKDHFLVSRSDLDQAGWCDVRFKIHDIAATLSEEGYIPIQYTDAVLKKDYDDLLNEDLSKYQTAIIRFSAFSSLPPSGRRLIMHFMSCHAKENWNFKAIYTIINTLRSDITRENIVYYMSRSDHIIRHPAFYRAIFKQWLNVSNKTVYDLHPDWGFKALAVIAENGQYYCDSPHIADLNKMATYLGSSVKLPNLANYDLAILSDVHPVDLEEAGKLIKTHRDMAEYLMITIAKDSWQEFVRLYKPWRVIRLNDCITDGANSDNYVMIIHQK